MSPSRGRAGMGLCQQLDSNVCSFAVVDFVTLVLARQNGMKLKAVMAITDMSPLGFASLHERNIQKVRDMETLTVACHESVFSQGLLSAIIRAMKVDTSKVGLVDVSPINWFDYLMDGHIDLAAVWENADYCDFVRQAENLGRRLNAFWARENNVDLYDAVLATTEKLVDENPDVVERFVKATVKGYRYTFDHIDEAVEITLKNQPDLAPRQDILRAQLESTRRLADTTNFREYGYGWFNEEKVRRSLEIISEAYVTTNKIAAWDICTNKFVKP